MQSKIAKETINELIEWDIKTWSKVLPFWESNFNIKPGLKVLSIGERGGGMSLYFALKGCTVTCTDYNEFPETIYNFHKKHNVTDKISYVQSVDVCELSQFKESEFDIIAFKSVLGALTTKGRQQKAFDEMYRVLRVDGALLFAENLKATKLHSFLRKKFIKWDSYWRYFDLKKDTDFYKKFSRNQFASNGFLAVFGRNEKQRKVLATVDSIYMWALPKTWRYVLFGVLIK